MHLAFLTVGDPERLTGGYLYHREVFARLRARGLVIDELLICGASLDAQLAAAPQLGSFDPRNYQLIVVDALARAAVALWLDQWRAERPLVAMIHELPGVAGDDSPAEQAWAAPLLRADRLITVSRHGAELLVARGAAREHIAVVAPGYDRLAALAGPAGRSGESGNESPALALCVAQWIRRKGIVELIEVWGAAPRPGWQLHLVGETSADSVYTAEVQATIAASGAQHVTIHGAVSNQTLVQLYRRAALFVLPSRYEGYGMAFAEALSFGLPVLACAAGPLPELLGPAGLCVPLDQPAALLAALNRLLTDTALRKTMAAAAQQQAATLPTWDATAEGFLHALRTVE